MKLMKEHEVFLFKPYMVNIIREIRGNSWIKYNFFEKTNPIFPRFKPKNGYLPKSKPIQTQSNPILYLFMQNEPKLPHFYPKNKDFPKKQTQNEPKQNQPQKRPKTTYTPY